MFKNIIEEIIELGGCTFIFSGEEGNDNLEIIKGVTYDERSRKDSKRL